MLDATAGPRRTDGRCPQCGHPQSEVRLDLDACELECTHCQARFRPTTVFTDRQILSRFQHLPPEAQERLFGPLGFERLPPWRTMALVVYGFCGLLFLGMIVAAIGCIISRESVAFGIFALLVLIPGGCFQIWGICRSEMRPRWQRRRSDGKGKTP